MQYFKSFFVLVTLAASMSAMAAQSSTVQSSITTTTTTTTTSSPQTFPVYEAPSSPTGVSVNTAISDAPSSPTGTTYSGSTNWVNANTLETVNFNQNVGTSATTTSSNNPLLSTDPQFNVMDVKVTASGGCEVKKNGTVIMTGGFAGSPCQKLYGKGVGQTTSTSSHTLPAEYLPSNLDVSFDAQTLDARAY